MATVVGVFSNRQDAEKAVKALRDQGFEKEISIAAKDDRKKGGQGQGRADMEAGNEDGMGMGNMGNVGDGTAWGGALGGVTGLLAGVGALAIPGIGPIVAAGPLAAALTGAVAGGVAGGLLDMGIPEEEGKAYEEDIKQGRVLAVVEADESRADTAEDLLREMGADRVKRYH